MGIELAFFLFVKCLTSSKKVSNVETILVGTLRRIIG
jgi:hypothetical protein